MSHYLLDEFKIYKDINLDDTDKDDKISLFLSAVEKFLNKTYGIYLKKTDEITEKFSVLGNTILLPSNNVEVTKVVINDKEWDLDDLYLKGNVLKAINNPFPNGVKNAEVTYKLGFDEIPYDLKIAVFILTSRLLSSAENSGEEMEYLADPVGGKMRMVKNIPSDFFLLIAPYRTMFV